MNGDCVDGENIVYFFQTGGGCELYFPLWRILLNILSSVWVQTRASEGEDWRRKASKRQ